MLQRKQSVFLLLSVLLFVATYYFPFATVGPVELHGWYANNLATPETTVEGINNYFFALPLSIAATLTLIAIFLFGNRKRQMLFVRLTFLFFAAAMGLLTLYIMSAREALPGEPFSLDNSFFVPFASFALNMVALRAIRKDEQLVRSVDRIR